ncbi:probable galacturonosyltransferase 12 [Nymphaea colorata]|nr:probable galacturonosyltransferase 12 [Nymphaea colorata]
MQLHISPSLKSVTVSTGKGFRELIKVKAGPRRVSYRTLFYSLLFLTFMVRFVFVITAMDKLDGGGRCSSLGCVGRRLTPRLWDRRGSKVPEDIYEVLQSETGGMAESIVVPQTFEDFIEETKTNRTDSRTFALKLKAFVEILEQKARTAKIQEYLYRHVASSSIPKQLHCLALKLASEYSSNAQARLQLPSPELVPALVDNSYYHFILASDNILAAWVVASSLVDNSLMPEKVVFHVITDRKTYAPMQAWFSLHSLAPAVIEVKSLHHFDWFTKGKVPVLEAMERDQKIRYHYRGGSSAIVANRSERPYIVASRLQALSPKYNSVMNHIRIYLPQLFPSLDKVVFLDDDVVVQSDLSPLWEIDMKGKVNGAVETCRGDDPFVMSKRLKSYLNFSHPLIAENFDPQDCAWAYGMNVFDLQAWRRTNISETYHYWLQENLRSGLNLWQLGTLPPGLIAFHGQVHVIDPVWHMLGLGYQANTSVESASRAAVIHFNGRAKPWLDIAFPHLRPLWAKYVDRDDKFIRGCSIMVS